jgi:small subunit ribosomal protein S1
MTEEVNFSEDIQQPVEETQTTENSPSVEEPQLPEMETVPSVEESQIPEMETKPSVEESHVPEMETAPYAEEIQEDIQHEEENAELVKSPKKVIETQPKIIPNTDDFNWEELGKDNPLYSAEEQKKMEDIYNQTFSAIVEQEVVEGTIVAKNSREIVVNIGFKSDGVIPANELRYREDLNIGDKVEVYVESQEDAAGQLLLSHKKARLLRSWERVNRAYENSEIITGCVRSKTKGGLIVDVFGIEAFLPGSQIDVKPIRDYDIFVDKTMEFKVVKINAEYKNVVVSHKALIESELEAQRSEIMAGLEKGQVLEGIVKNITSYGAFIDLGGVDGLVHITDISWGRVSDPKEVLELDQKINVVILDFDEAKKRIALGLKQLTTHPWDALNPELKVGDQITGKVVVIADYGAFVEVSQGIEGLIHVSEMSWSQHLRTAQDFLSVGDTVTAVILTLDREERKMSLGIKQLIPDPWITIAEKYPVDSRHTAIVRNFTIFGIFVELEEGVDGLIHVSDLSWSKKVKHPAEFTKIGAQIDVVVLEMDAENRRLSLGHKQLEANPWDVFETMYTIGSIHQATVINHNDKGVMIGLQGTEGFVYSRGLLREDGSIIKMGDTENFKVVDFSKENKKLVLSHAKIWQDIKDAEREAKEEGEKKRNKDGLKITKRISENVEKSTLGDLDAFINLKADLEMEESETQKQSAVKTGKKSGKTSEIQKGETIAIEWDTPETQKEETIATESETPETQKEETIAIESETPEIQKEEAIATESEMPETQKEETIAIESESPEIQKEEAIATESEDVAETVITEPIEPTVVEEEKPKKTRAKKTPVKKTSVKEEPIKEEAAKEDAVIEEPAKEEAVKEEAVKEEKPKKTRAKKATKDELKKDE